MTGDLNPIDIQAGLEKVNLHICVRGNNGDVTFVGRNITDKITASGAADFHLTSGSHLVVPSKLHLPTQRHNRLLTPNCDHWVVVSNGYCLSNNEHPK